MYRAYFSTPETVTAPDGTPVNAAHGFLGMVARLVSDWDPELLVCATDADWRPQWRVDLIDSYKTHRLGDEPDPVEAQFPIVFELLEDCGVAVVGATNYEAEDVIGALAPKAPGEVGIVSGDRDLFQLVRDPDVYVLYPRRGVADLIVVNEKEVERRFGIPGRKYADYAILRGDPSDGLPGVRGVGEKTAAALITRYGSLEAVVEAAMISPDTAALAKVAADLDYLDRATQVVTIATDAPVGNPDMQRPKTGPSQDVYEKAEKNGLLGAVRRLAAALEGRVSASGAL